MSKWLLGLAPMLTLAALGAQANVSGATPSVQIRYGSGVPMHQQQRLDQDLVILDSLKLKDSTGEMKRLFELNEVSSESVKKWLSERVRVIVDEKFQINETTVKMLGVGVTYPGVSATTNSMGPHDEKDETSDEPAGPQVVMSNLGGGLYMFGKSLSVFLGVDVAGVGVLEVKSPRLGLLQVGSGLFSTISSRMDKSAVENRLHSLFRLGTLLHEARHSDGSGKSLAFAHVLCPIGHDFVGVPACDTPSNGPYRLEALFLAAAKAACGEECSVKDKEIMDLLILDSESRVLSGFSRTQIAKPADSQSQDGKPADAAVASAGAPKKEGPGVCGFLEKLKIEASFCGPTLAEQVIEWDSAPESL